MTWWHSPNVTDYHDNTSNASDRVGLQHAQCLLLHVSLYWRPDRWRGLVFQQWYQIYVNAERVHGDEYMRFITPEHSNRVTRTGRQRPKLIVSDWTKNQTWILQKTTFPRICVNTITTSLSRLIWIQRIGIHTILLVLHQHRKPWHSAITCTPRFSKMVLCSVCLHILGWVVAEDTRTQWFYFRRHVCRMVLGCCVVTLSVALHCSNKTHPVWKPRLPPLIVGNKHNSSIWRQA